MMYDVLLNRGLDEVSEWKEDHEYFSIQNDELMSFFTVIYYVAA